MNGLDVEACACATAGGLQAQFQGTALRTECLETRRQTTSMAKMGIPKLPQHRGDIERIGGLPKTTACVSTSLSHGGMSGGGPAGGTLR